MTYVLAYTDPTPSEWNYYPNESAAVLALATTDVAEYTARVMGRTSPMLITTVEKWDQIVKDYWTNQPAIEIAPERWYDMLEILPPRRWITGPNWQRFDMSEHTSGPYTEQFLLIETPEGPRAWSRIVDTTDPKTWLDGEDFLLGHEMEQGRA